jgi:hypothetical protein
MILTLEEAREILRLDSGDNDIIITPLLEAMPSYLEVSTGYKACRGVYSPLARTVAGFLLQLWYNGDGMETEKLQRTIDHLLTALSFTVKRHGGR